MYTNGLPVIEPVAVLDTYVSGIACIEPLGGEMFRVTHYAVQRCPHTSVDQAVIVSRMIVSKQTVMKNREYITAAMDGEPLVIAH